METIVKENKMATMPVNKLLISMAVPMMISMLVQALYNIVDSVFVAKYSASCMTAISLVFPIQTLMIAGGAGIGVGMNALLSRFLGAKDKDNVNKTAFNGITIYIICYLIFLLVGLFVAEPFMKAQASSALIADEGSIYLKIVCCCSFGMFTQFCFERMLQATGRTIYSMYTQMTGAVINIILDPILIFGLFGAPRMGMAGAAIATVVGQCCAGLLALFFNLIRDSFRFKRKTLRNNLKGYDLMKIEQTLKNYHFDLSVRAEELPLEVFVDISNNLVK